MNDITQAYDSASHHVGDLLGTTISVADPDRAIIEPWARSVAGPILDVGAGTGRWTGHLRQLGHHVTGLEPAKRLVTRARRDHPAVQFRVGSIADLAESTQRWAGLLVWYAIIHMNPAELAAALVTLRQALQDDGTMLLSFFTGSRLEAFEHPVAPAYRWPLTEMVQTLQAAGFDMMQQHRNPHSPHAYILARATDVA